MINITETHSFPVTGCLHLSQEQTLGLIDPLLGRHSQYEYFLGYEVNKGDSFNFQSRFLFLPENCFMNEYFPLCLPSVQDKNMI